MNKIFYLAACVAIVCSCGPSGKVQNEYLQDTAVDVGYGSMPQSSLTTSVSQIALDDNAYTYSNMLDYIRGKVPGVMVVGDKIQIRGINSINSSTDPLVMIDGVEASSINDVAPVDVYSVSVLKDASASIYGVRGANGVILITTKGAAQAAAQAAAAKKEARAAAKEARKKDK